jgi:glycosyltransferase involved in cell wall biosynthesis
MRLAHFIHRYPPALGGSEAYFARLSRWCAAKGDEVAVFTTNARALEAFWSADADLLPAGIDMDGDVQVRRYPLMRFPGRRWLLKGLSLVPQRAWQCLTLPCNPITPSMWRDAGRAPFAFDAVHASAFPYAFPILCARRLARRLRIPFFITPFLHLGDPNEPQNRTRRGYTQPALRWLLKEADGVFVQTPSERDAALALGVQDKRIFLQGLGVELTECTGGDRTEARRRWNLPDDACVIGHLANQSWEKGTNDLLQALEPLWRRRRPIHLLLAGPQMPNFTRFWESRTRNKRYATEPLTSCAALGHEPVRQLGPLTDADKRDFYAAIDVFALPSRSDSFGLVLLEAWANGVPNVVYRAGGIADVVQHERDGLLVPCGSVAGLTAALELLCDDIDSRLDMGLCGQARLGREFRWEDKLTIVRRAIATRVGVGMSTAVPAGS